MDGFVELLGAIEVGIVNEGAVRSFNWETLRRGFHTRSFEWSFVGCSFHVEDVFMFFLGHLMKNSRVSTKQIKLIR